MPIKHRHNTIQCVCVCVSFVAVSVWFLRSRYESAGMTSVRSRCRRTAALYASDCASALYCRAADAGYKRFSSCPPSWLSRLHSLHFLTDCNGKMFVYCRNGCFFVSTLSILTVELLKAEVIHFLSVRFSLDLSLKVIYSCTHVMTVLSSFVMPKASHT